MRHGESKGKTGYAEKLCVRKRWPDRSTFAKRLLNDPTKTAEGRQRYRCFGSIPKRVGTIGPFDQRPAERPSG